MKAVDFIEMQKQDLETHKDKLILAQVVAVMEEVLKGIPNAEIEHTKTAEDCYNQMYEFAKSNNQNNVYVFTPDGTIEFVRKYLGVPDLDETVVEPAKGTRKRRNLEDFF